MTEYNGSKTCSCGGQISPVQAMMYEECQGCREARLTALKKNRMI